MEHKRYIGLRVKTPVSLGNMRQFLTIDIGFSDQVVPAPVKMTYPTLLDMEEPVVIAYSSVSVIAEKFEAMIDLGELNSRMKDFYDVWQLLQGGNILKTKWFGRRSRPNSPSTLDGSDELFPNHFGSGILTWKI